MTQNNSINSGPIASDAEMIAGVNQRNLATPANLKALTDARIVSGTTQNLGLSLSSGNLVLNSADGSALSGGNPGKVYIPSNVTFGNIIEYTLTANQTLTASNLTGNLFNTVTARAWSEQCPFFVYIVSSTTDSAPTMMVSRQSHHTVAPASGNIGTPSSAVADTQYAFFAVSNVTVASYANQACVCIGSFRMTKDTSNVWTITTLNETDGIGRFKEGEIFNMQIGQGATGTYFLNTTPPTWSSSSVTYSIDRQGMCNFYFSFSGDGGTDGSGASACEIVLPFDIDGSQGGSLFRRGSGAGTAFFAGTTRTNLYFVYPFTTQSLQLKRVDTNANLLNSAFSNGDRALSGSCSYFMDSA